MFLNKEKVYSFNEGFIKMSGKEKVNLKQKEKLVNYIDGTLIYCTLHSKRVFAAPSTGIPKLDQGGWKLVGVSQSVIFWAAMIYAFKSLLELTIKGEGSWKKVGTGFLICVMNYLIPWGFELIRGIFV